MNLSENIIYLAATNAKSIIPKRLDEINNQVPYFHLFKDAMGKYDITCYNYSNHDNAPRMDLFQAYMRHGILPNVKNTGITGYYNIELHDSYTYLNKDFNYNNILTFSKFKNDNGPILIPDPYMIVNWGGHINTLKDEIEWKDKQDKICFYGTTTGNRNPLKNTRINLVTDYMFNPVCEFKITKVAQMKEEDIISTVGMNAWKNIYSKDMVSPYEQMKNKFHLVVDGNTCRFDVWNYKTNCLNMKLNSPEMLWYYPMLNNNIHYVDVESRGDQCDMIKKYNYYINNPRDALRITQNSKVFADEFFIPKSHMQYTTSLFEYVEPR